VATEHRNPNLYDYLARARAVEANRATDEGRRSALLQSAIVAVENARTLAPRDVYYSVELALFNDALNRFERAEAAFQRAMELDPKSLLIKQDYETHQNRWRESDDPVFQ